MRRTRSIKAATTIPLVLALGAACMCRITIGAEAPSESTGELAGMLDGQANYFAGEAEDLGHNVRLFLDPSAYADRWDVVARVNEPAKHPENPVVTPDQPWEHSIGLPSVLYDDQDKIFRMWYANYDTGKWGGTATLEQSKRYPYIISYAESPDGMHWTKPLFENVPYMGYDKTNIVFTGHDRATGFHVMHTPDHLRRRGRFMLWYRDSPPGHGLSMNLAYSDDGINWELDTKNPVYRWALDVRHFPVYDERRELWLLFGRPHALAANEGIIAARISERGSPLHLAATWKTGRQPGTSWFPMNWTAASSRRTRDTSTMAWRP